MHTYCHKIILHKIVRINKAVGLSTLIGICNIKEVDPSIVIEILFEEVDGKYFAYIVKE